MPTRDEIESIRTRIDILDLIGRYVTVRASGSNYVGLCPFHPDESPSLTISPEKGLFHCFGCGAGGDAFSFLMRMERLEFPDAARRLAEMAGVGLTESGRSGRSGRAGPSDDGTGGLRQLAERVAQFYERSLEAETGRPALAYLRERGFGEDTQRRFRLGYAPPASGTLLNAFRHEVDELGRLGLVRRGSDGRWAFFRHRVMFPLMSSQGEVLGFAGRSIDGSEPKYLNTPNTPIFAKRRLLYGLAQGREALQQREEALLVEGYTDVLRAHQHGFAHAVASMGTSLTDDHAHLLKRYVGRARLAYDRDTAGQAATLRGVKQLVNAGLDVRVVLLPPESDPDALLAREGTDAFRRLLGEAIPFPEFYVRTLLEAHDVRDWAGQEALVADARTFLRDVERPVLRQAVLKELAAALDLPVEDLRQTMSRMKGRETTATIEPRSPGRWGVEEHLMHLLLRGSYSISRAMERLAPEDFARYADAVSALFALAKEEDGPDRLSGSEGRRLVTAWLDRLPDEQAERLRALAVSDERDSDSERALAQLEGRLRLESLDRRLRALPQRIQEAEARGDRASVEELYREQQALSVERRRLMREIGWGAIASQGGGTHHA